LGSAVSEGRETMCIDGAVVGCETAIDPGEKDVDGRFGLVHRIVVVDPARVAIVRHGISSSWWSLETAPV
jgi:hypothetical protein